jgi:signal peptidase I
LTSATKKLWKNDYVQTVIVVILIAGIVFGFWYGSQIVLNTKIPPALAVVSGSMCVPYDGPCDGWTHPFDRTLHIGDIIVIQGINAKDLKTDYPNSDIIVFHRPDNPSELIVHRIVATTAIDGKLYFFTKGDGNGYPDTWPTIPKANEYDSWYSGNSSIPLGAVSQDLVEGKVVMRIPWIGHVAIFMHDVLGVSNSFVVIPVIVILLVLLIIVELVEPLLRKKKPSVEQKSVGEQP